MVSWSHQGRFRSEAAFASFAGVSPIPASSGLTNRHRLNRSGDRQLNRAVHTITLIRMRLDPATKTYVARRISEGKTSRDAQRCLQRAISRQLSRSSKVPSRTTARSPTTFPNGLTRYSSLGGGARGVEAGRESASQSSPSRSRSPPG
ncbi:transposase [Streptomyces sp. NPDC001553]|uniref:transposase n=1 Tax=Streptomyces sp. NPDC001553 TaxID=3154385 RepID=UPI00332100E2